MSMERTKNGVMPGEGIPGHGGCGITYFFAVFAMLS